MQTPLFIKQILQRFGLFKPKQTSIHTFVMSGFLDTDQKEVNDLIEQIEDEIHLAFKYLPVCSHPIIC